MSHYKYICKKAKRRPVSRIFSAKPNQAQIRNFSSDSSYKSCTSYSETWTENLSDLSRCANMARGNQRDQAREKAAKANKVILLFVNL